MNIFEKYPSSKFLNGVPEDSDLFPLRSRIADLFQFLDGLEDSHFEQELNSDYHARLWEMTLAKILKSEGYEPTSADSGPDFSIEMAGTRILIEAVCPGPGEDGNPNSVPPIVYGASEFWKVPVEQIVLRIRSALEAKKRRFAQYIEQGIVFDGDTCIIAISSSKINQASGLWPPPIMRATHGLGNPYVVFEKGKGSVGEGIESCTSIPKANGLEIDTTFFFSEENSLVAAVLYSECSVFRSGFDPFRESMLIHNPKARVPLAPGFLRKISEVWTICSSDGSRWHPYQINKTADGS